MTIPEMIQIFFFMRRPLIFFDPEKHRINKNDIPAMMSRNRSSSASAGMNPYNDKSVDDSVGATGRSPLPIDNNLSLFLSYASTRSAFAFLKFFSTDPE
jgi:hypothetical protein